MSSTSTPAGSTVLTLTFSIFWEFHTFDLFSFGLAGTGDQSEEEQGEERSAVSPPGEAFKAQAKLKLFREGWRAVQQSVRLRLKLLTGKQLGEESWDN